MKFLLTTALIAGLARASSSSHMSLQISTILSNLALPGIDIKALGPSLKKAECAVPCIEEPIRHLNCDGQGPLQTLCTHFDEIQQKARPCVDKCGVSAPIMSYIGTVSRNMCTTI
ncbi:hypothetical protein XA68_17168 [Ophiocordyceps unilateralis]|uniref:Extracellular membrane protein CFEM domain-containing protein n=1 Tax=Ophiocordyceps unilateralis TaxID=268505 RepID=A0A2A9PKF1_OPHUN|nr:hypothetical protein XA68_17168 [Ophiocordyceps unilateralis]